MIVIDGSYGEGGGALLRTAAALSALTGKSIHVTNIRSKRPKPGLMPQHLNALRSVAQLSGAELEGLHLGSTEIIFKPGELSGGEYNVNIQTAGSLTLVLQSFLIPAAFAGETVQINLQGGTDVRWSPPIDYLTHVSLPILRIIGLHAEIKLVKRGHYPKGGGKIIVDIHPANRLEHFKLIDLELDHIKGISHAVNLPKHVAERQARAAKKLLEKEGYPVDIEMQHSDKCSGPGSGIVLWTEYEEDVSLFDNVRQKKIIGRVGGSDLGKIGKRAEVVGKSAAVELLNSISRGAAIDRFMGDQIIPYMAVAGNSIIKTAELTQHTLTNIHIAELITGRKFKVDGVIGQPSIIKAE